MNHSYLPSQLDKNKCASCARSLLAHTVAATCEACSKVCKCDIVDSMLLCPDCTEKHLAPSSATLPILEVTNPEVTDNPTQYNPERTDKLLEIHQDYYDKLTPMRPILNELGMSVLADAQSIDASIRVNGDAFNAETVSHIELKKVIWSDASLTEEQKIYKFQEVLTQRYETFAQHMFVLDNLKHDDYQGQLAIATTLRNFGSELHKEFAAKLKELDNNYQPVTPKAVKPVVKKVKKSPMEQLIEAYMLLHNCTHTEALLALQKGGKK